MRDRDAWLCFEDEAGQGLRPPKARTWSRRGHTPVVDVTGSGSGRISLASMICVRPGERARLVFRMLVHHHRKGEKKGFEELDLARLLDAAHHQLGGRDIVLIWDNATIHKDAAMRALLAAWPWLTAYRLPPYCPQLNPDEGVWAHLKRSLGNLAAGTTDQLAAQVRTRLKKMQYRPDLLDGFIAETGLALTPA